MPESADLVYDLAVPCCGRTWHVRRRNELTRRVEQAAGAIYPLCLRLRTSAVTMDEVANLIHVLVKDEPGAPALAAIGDWLFAHGLQRVAPPLAAELLTLISGNDAVAEHKSGARRKGDGPFVPTAG